MLLDGKLAAAAAAAVVLVGIAAVAAHILDPTHFADVVTAATH